MGSVFGVLASVATLPVVGQAVATAIATAIAVTLGASLVCLGVGCLLDDGDLDQQAQQDMINRAARDARFGTAIFRTLEVAW